jgi:hypothetical protein
LCVIFKDIFNLMPMYLGGISSVSDSQPSVAPARILI